MLDCRVVGRIACLAGAFAFSACGAPSDKNRSPETATPAASSNLTSTVTSSGPALASIQIDAVTTMRQVLLGTPSGDGMVQLSVADAPKGAVFLMVRYRSSHLPAGVEPGLVGSKGVAHPLKQLTPLQDSEPKDGPSGYVAIFQVPEKATAFVLTHRDRSAPIDVAALLKKTPEQP